MARRKAPDPVDDPLVAEVIAEDPTLLKIPRRPALRVESKDDLPTMAECIRALDQSQRDDILRAMPTTKSRF